MLYELLSANTSWGTYPYPALELPEAENLGVRDIWVLSSKLPVQPERSKQEHLLNSILCPKLGQGGPSSHFLQTPLPSVPHPSPHPAPHHQDTPGHSHPRVFHLDWVSTGEWEPSPCPRLALTFPVTPEAPLTSS